jgi:hypothetical protein
MTTTTKNKDPYIVEHDAQVRLLKDISDDDLACRIGALGHAWQAVQPDFDSPPGLDPIAKQCIHCTAVGRADVSQRYGQIVGKWRYNYPDGYLVKLPSTGGRIKSTAVRSEWARRLRSAVLPPIMEHPMVKQ